MWLYRLISVFLSDVCWTLRTGVCVCVCVCVYNLGVHLLIFQLPCRVFFFKILFIFIFREREREGKERERNIRTISTCLPLTCPLWGPGLKPKHVPWLGIEPVTLWFAGQHSIHWATPARAQLPCRFKIVHKKKKVEDMRKNLNTNKNPLTRSYNFHLY